jgi:hypothetical protein
MNTKKRVGHSEHGEHGGKTRGHIVCIAHLAGEVKEPSMLGSFAVRAVSPWYELGA